MRELRTTEKLIITVAPTGGFITKEANPNLPVLPQEIADAVYDAWNEGASIVHIHARDEKTNRGTADPEVLRDIDRRIREKKCDIIIQHSSAHDFFPRMRDDKRLLSIEMDPEMASLDIQLPGMLKLRSKGMVMRDEEPRVTVIDLDDIEHGAKAMLDRGVKPELEVFNPVVIDDVYTLIEKGLIQKPYWISFVMGMRRINRASMTYSPRLLLQLVDSLPPDSMFTVLGVATDELPATTQSILFGGHVRVGFEDNIHYVRGQLAESNAQLVAKAARIGRELGCEIATPSEARAILGIPQL